MFDDSTVTTVDESQVVTRYAYVLFYRRRNSPVERPPRAGHSEHHPDLGPAAEAAASQVRHGGGRGVLRKLVGPNSHGRGRDTASCPPAIGPCSLRTHESQIGFSYRTP